VIIAAERGKARLDELVGDDADIAIAAVTVAELFLGVEMATDAHKRKRRGFVEAVLDLLPVEDYDVDVARSHARLLAQARRAGLPRGAHDLIIAATAHARQRTVITADKAAGFEGLSEVEVRYVT